jgi:hypothetical protein
MPKGNFSSCGQQRDKLFRDALRMEISVLDDRRRFQITMRITATALDPPSATVKATRKFLALSALISLRGEKRFP